MSVISPKSKLAETQPSIASDKDSVTARPTVANDSFVNRGEKAPIGLFDSGVGGLSVYTHLQQTLPNERYIYYADTLNVPYGHRSSSEITELSLAAVDWLVGMGCKMVVIACNSASAHALAVARQRYPYIPIVGLVPALKPAVLNSQSKAVAVLATQATLDGSLLNTVIADYAEPSGVEVIKWFDPNLVPWVESGMSPDSDTAHRLKQQIHQFAAQKVDHIVLGCTHYPFFRDFMVQEINHHGLDIQILDSGAAIAHRVSDLLSAPPQSNGNQTPNQHRKCKSGVVFANTSMPYISLATPKSRYSDSDISENSQLAFYYTNPDTSLNEVSKMVNRLLRHE